MHGHGNDGIEIAVTHDFFEELRERTIEKIVALEFECMQQALERATIVTPCIRPGDRKRIVDAADATDVASRE